MTLYESSVAFDLLVGSGLSLFLNYGNQPAMARFRCARSFRFCNAGHVPNTLALVESRLLYCKR